MEVAVVTGASSGFGLLISLELAKEGYCVIATVRNVNKGSELIKLAKKYGVDERLQLFELDVTCNHSIEKWKNKLGELGRIDLLVNNAGYACGGFVEEVSIDEYRNQFETNVFGVIQMTKTALPIMRKQRRGRIINISSISGRIGFPGLSPYIASKHALEGLSESLRLELRPFGIDVVLIEPGSYQTNIWTSGKKVAKKSLNPKSPYYKTMVEIERHIEDGKGKFGDPLEVAHLVRTLAKKRKTKLRYMIGNGVKISLFLKLLLPWTYWEKLLLGKLKTRN